MIQADQPTWEMKLVTDEAEIAKARAQDARFAKNMTWFNVHSAEIYAEHRGKCWCVAGQELFVADSPEAALACAKAAHPDDDGFFTGSIPKERTYRIYAHRRILAPLR